MTNPNGFMEHRSIKRYEESSEVQETQGWYAEIAQSGHKSVQGPGSQAKEHPHYSEGPD
jgi:hypothetical protein